MVGRFRRQQVQHLQKHRDLNLSNGYALGTQSTVEQFNGRQVKEEEEITLE